MARIAGRFGRVEPRAVARAYLLGLLSGVERKNCRQLAERAGHARPGPMQRLLLRPLGRRCGPRRPAGLRRRPSRRRRRRSRGRRDRLCEEGPLLGRGTTQYTGTAGRIENSQVGVFLAYAGSRGRALIDRRLYLPESSRPDDLERRNAAGIPPTVQFATKPRLAAEMVTAALDAGITAPWVTGDEAYGQDPQLRAALEARGIGYVLAVACPTRVKINYDRTLVRADTVASRLPATAWQRHSAGNGAKGPRYYDWAWVPIGTGSHRHLLIRHNRSTDELAFYLCWSPTEVPLSELVHVAGIRWMRGGMLPSRQGSSRPRSLPSPTPDLLAPAHHARHARPGLPDRDRRRHGTTAARRYPLARRQQRSDHTDRARVPSPPGRRLPPTSHDSGQAAGLVQLAQTPPGNSPKKPLPTTGRRRICRVNHETVPEY